MTEDGKASIDALLAAARADYAGRILSKIAEISSFVARSEWHEARRSAHKLRGSAATYGFTELGLAAGRVEDLLLAADGSPDEPMRARIHGFLVDAEAFARGVAANVANATEGV
jgi:HPt (histidine-containing phosphotransfer) domain-containing protein